jgi:predicted nuclease of restriction endonuclease-like (RecB) superfamily
MKQFYETYCDQPDLRPLLDQVSWSNQLILLSGAKSLVEKEFYLRLCIQERYSKRDLKRQLDAGYFERVMLANQKLSPLVRELPEDVTGSFKDSYVLEFLDLPERHPERELKQRIIANLRNFLLEFGRDFAFMGEEYRLQVGNHDYYVDLLFYNRNLNCLVAVELEVVEFEPEFLGKLNFYLEALDRDVRKPHENPSIGILLCRGKDNEVVEYALSRSLSPTLVADYQTKLPDKQILQAKLHELFSNSLEP